MLTYDTLSPQWKRCFCLAREAYLNASLPIGCIMLDSNGKEIAGARARMVYGSRHSSMTQHAEIETLALVPLPLLEQRTVFYSTVEPCPMCFGAVNVARVSELHFGTRDPWSGSTDLLDGNWYMRRKHIEIRRGPDGFERILASWLCHAFTHKSDGTECDGGELVERWKLVVPDLDTVLLRLRTLDPGYSAGDGVFFAELAGRVGEADA